MGEIVINPRTCKLCIVEYGNNGESSIREITKEDIAKLSESQRKLVESIQQQARLMLALAEIQEQAAQEIEKSSAFARQKESGSTRLSNGQNWAGDISPSSTQPKTPTEPNHTGTAHALLRAQRLPLGRKPIAYYIGKYNYWSMYNI